MWICDLLAIKVGIWLLPGFSHFLDARQHESVSPCEFLYLIPKEKVSAFEDLRWGLYHSLNNQIPSNTLDAK